MTDIVKLILDLFFSELNSAVDVCVFAVVDV